MKLPVNFIWKFLDVSAAAFMALVMIVYVPILLMGAALSSSSATCVVMLWASPGVIMGLISLIIAALVPAQQIRTEIRLKMLTILGLIAGIVGILFYQPWCSLDIFRLTLFYVIISASIHLVEILRISKTTS